MLFHLIWRMISNNQKMREGGKVNLIFSFHKLCLLSSIWLCCFLYIDKLARLLPTKNYAIYRCGAHIDFFRSCRVLSSDSLIVPSP